MRGKALLLISCLFLTGCQGAAKQSVSAETKESAEGQQAVSENQTSSSLSVTNESSSQPSEQRSVQESSIKEEALPASETAETRTASSSLESQTATEPTATTESVPQAAQQVSPPPAIAKKAEETVPFAVVKNQTTEAFIQTIGKDAQQIAWEEGLYASVMIAQAILETGSGNSQLARPPHHNLFGIKGSYQGKQVSFNTQEDTGNGQLYTIQAAFRQYPSYKESLKDYAALLKNGLSGNPGFYQATWKENAATYQEATKALTGNYATDTSYDKKLNALIETYQLTTYDGEPNKEAVEEIPETEALEKEVEPSTNEASRTEEEINETAAPGIRVSETQQPVVVVPPAAQRPAKQLSGQRIAQ